MYPSSFPFYVHTSHHLYFRVPTRTIQSTRWTRIYQGTAHALIACQARDGNRAGRMCGEDATCSSECAAGISSVYRYGSVITCREQGLVLSIHTAVRVSTDKRCQGFGRLSSVYSLILSSRESYDGAFVGARCRLYPCTALSGLYECS